MAMPKAYGYCRVSTHRQAKSGLGLDAQQDGIKKYYDYKFADTHQWAGFAVDPGQSGSIRFCARVAGGELNQKLNPGDAVIIFKLDRAFRNLIDGADTIQSWGKRGVIVKVIDFDIDTTTAAGKLQLHNMLGYAQFERDRASERLQDCFAQRRLRGLVHGGTIGYGWKRSKDQRAVPVPEEQQVIAKFMELRRKGFTISAIRQWCRVHGVRNRTSTDWEPSTLSRILRRAELNVVPNCRHD